MTTEIETLRAAITDLRIERDELHELITALREENKALGNEKEPAERARVSKQMKWQPIETAPTDGTRILLRGRNGKIADGHYGQPDGFANPKRFVWPYINATPTHWAPLALIAAAADLANRAHVIYSEVLDTRNSQLIAEREVFRTAIRELRAELDEVRSTNQTLNETIRGLSIENAELSNEVDNFNIRCAESGD